MRRTSSTSLTALVLTVSLAACGEDQAGSGASGGAAGGAPLGGGGAGAGSSTGGAGGGSEAEPAADEALRYLTGRFDSAAQAEQNPSYFAIQLWTCPVDAPGLGERVLYVEQARMDLLDQPYRQRLYVVESGTDPTLQAVSRVFELTSPATFVGLCESGTLRAVQAEEAIARDGCDVFLTWDGATFEGGTQGEGCESTLNGATYATSEVTLGEATLESWDRGWDASDAQVWGAVAGPYVFDRKTPLP